tara:strand:- start:77 stop:1096 length:1020 start_codon:yes stop_codon:yes gene_type:complete
MRDETYRDTKKRISDFDARYVLDIPLEEILRDDKSQIRHGGHHVKNVVLMQESLTSCGQLVPVTARKVPGDCAQWFLMDGNTRWLGAARAGLKTLKVETYTASLCLTHDEWYDFQCDSNNHLVSENNSSPDIQRQLGFRVQDGYFDRRFGYEYKDDPEVYFTETLNWSDAFYGVERSKLRDWLKKIFTGAISQEYRAYDKSEAMRHTKDYNSFGWKPPELKGSGFGAGQVHNGVAVYSAGQMTRLDKDSFSNASKLKRKNPKVRIMCVIHVEKMFDINENKLDARRNVLIEEYDTQQKQHGVRPAAGGNYTPVWSGLYVLPQIKTGPSKEAYNSLIKLR